LTESQGTNWIDAQQDATPKDKNVSKSYSKVYFWTDTPSHYAIHGKDE
jgi:hypothetical protein